MKKFVLALVSASAITLVTTVGAQAAGNGAVTIHQNPAQFNGCQTDPSTGVVACLDFHGSVEIVTTPSGNAIVHENEHGTFTATAPDGSSQSFDVDHFAVHATTTSDRRGVTFAHEDFSFSLTSATGVTKSCTVDVDLHATLNPDGTANLQYDRESTSGTACP